MSLVLSIFPGIGLLDMAFEEEGFCIVRGPDLLWGGKRKKKPGVSRLGPDTGPRMSTAAMLELQGCPSDLLDEAPFTESAKRKAIGNGVPLPMGRAIARAVTAALAR